MVGYGYEVVQQGFGHNGRLIGVPKTAQLCPAKIGITIGQIVQKFVDMIDMDVKL